MFFILALIAIIQHASFCLAAPPLNDDQIKQMNNFKISSTDLQQFPFADYTVHTLPDRRRFYIDYPNDCIKNFIFNAVPWEESIDQYIRKFTKPGSIAVDIGAHIGTHTITLSQTVGPNGSVIAFEPQKKICRELIKNLELNQCFNVFPLVCALGNSTGSVRLGPENQSNEGSRYITNNESQEIVPLETLDNFHLSNVSIIKIDVENYEYQVLEGARETILSNRPVLLIEIMGNSIKAEEEGVDMGFFTDCTIHYLQSLGYALMHVSGRDYLAMPAASD